MQEQFYNPKTSSGFIATGLSNAQRARVGKNRPKKKESEDQPAVPQRVDQTAAIQDAIAFLKSAVSDQKDAIIAKTKETFEIRRFMYMNENFFETFPRFLDTAELVRIFIIALSFEYPR